MGMAVKTKKKLRGRPRFANDSIRKTSKMTVCLTPEYKAKLKKLSDLDILATPASMARQMIEEGINRRYANHK